jgi:hypothetical protein
MTGTDGFTAVPPTMVASELSVEISEGETSVEMISATAIIRASTNIPHRETDNKVIKRESGSKNLAEGPLPLAGAAAAAAAAAAGAAASFLSLSLPGHHRTLGRSHYTVTPRPR